MKSLFLCLNYLDKKSLLIISIFVYFALANVPKAYGQQYVSNISGTNCGTLTIQSASIPKQSPYANLISSVYAQQSGDGCTATVGTCWNSGTPGVAPGGSCSVGCPSGSSGSGQPWTRYTAVQCVKNELTRLCEPQYVSSGDNVCSIGDKYNSGGDTTQLLGGSCTCTAGGVYAQCCSAGNNVVEGNQPVSALPSDVDGHDPVEGYCPGGLSQHVTCGYPGADQPTCGVCPTPTPTPTPTFSCSSPCNPGDPKTCVNSSTYKTCVADSNSSTGFCWQNTACSSDNPTTPVCDLNTNTCVASQCINGRPCDANQVGTTQCDETSTTATKTCFDFGQGAYCWIQTGAGYCTGTSVCSDVGGPPTPTCVSPTPTTTSSPSGEPTSICSGAGFCPVIQQCTGPTTYNLVITVGFPSTTFNQCPQGTHCQDSSALLCSGAFNCPMSTCVADPPAQINGHIFTDYNQNRVKDSGEPDYSGSVNISANYSPGPYASYACQYYGAGEWPCSYYYGASACSTCTLPKTPSVTPGCFGGNYNSCISYCNSSPAACNNNAASFCNSQCTQGAQCCGGSYGVCSSWWCGSQSTCGTACTGTNTAPTSPTTSSSNANGTYSITGAGGGALAYGTYTVSASVAGATLSEPANGSSFNVTVGSSAYCTTGGSANASCSSGSVNNLNFGIKGDNPWIQSQGADIRKDSGLSTQIPANASCGAYASLPGNGGTPGIIYSGESTASFGAGAASATGWQAGGSSYPATYSPTRPNLIRTSYNYLLSVAQAGGVTAKDISQYCSGGGISNCLLSSNIPNGLYIANGNLNLLGVNSTYTFPSNKNFVILVNGNLNIETKILVPVGSTATFSSSGDITVDKSIGESSTSSTTSDVEGFYSADKNFIADGYNNCSTPDSRLNIAGSVVVNAALNGGTFQNNRNLCAGNSSCPAFFVKERTDFVLNAPDFIKHPSYIYQETAP